MASSSSGGYVSRYDVFISFRGKDTREAFTDHLYDTLRRAGVYTFLDDDAISRGEDLMPEIERGIRESRASIIVLSENYATSRWCLDELRLILHEKNQRTHFVFPIFYRVDPSHVKNQTGTFKIEAKAGTKWTEDKVKQWNEALKKVGNMKGDVVKGPETDFIKGTVDRIKEKLDLKHVYRQVNLVGMETRDKEINSWLMQPDCEIIAISGIGGCGKTTLARHIAYSNWHKFEGVSILEDIGRSTEELCQLQERLYSDIIEGKEKTIPSVWKGTCEIENALQRKKVLIVLDNIDTKKQLVDLLGTGTETRSKIIITTRAKDPSTWFQSITTGEQDPSTWFQSRPWRCRVHTMELLDRDESLTLLNLHAFKPNAPKEDYHEELAQTVLDYCQGNPLALEVLGSSLNRDSRKQFWKSILNSLVREVPGEIQNVLLTSYNSLHLESEKELFLHIACFFIGKDKDSVEKILEPDYSAISGIVTLTNSSLLFVSPDNKLMMHRLLQEMAKTIVLKESPRRPGDRSRVCHDIESYDVLVNKKGTKMVEGLALNMKLLNKEHVNGQLHGIHELVRFVDTKSFECMNNLKLLLLNQLELNGSYAYFSKDLRLLCLRGFHLEDIPSELYMGKLVAIDMSCSKLKRFQPPYVLPLLKILDLRESKDLIEICNVSLVPNLETLILRGCCKLVCDTLRGHKCVTLLDITGCENLCKREQPMAFERIQSTDRPSFQLPISLERLFAKDTNLADTNYFPLSFEGQTRLEYLNLVNSPFKNLPDYTHLENLLVLDLSSCKKLKTLLNLPRRLAELYTFYCTSLERVTFESHEYTLQEFRYEGCVNLSEVEDFFKIVPVATLTEADLGHMSWLRAYQECKVLSLIGDDDLTKGRSLRLEMLYEFNIRSISLPDKQKPNVIPENEYTSEDPLLSFDIPESHRNRKLMGLNLTFKYTLQGDEWVWFATIRTNNGVDLIYNAKVFGKPAANEVGIWLSYWPIGESLHDGDEVNVAIVVTKGLEIYGCGASLVYTDEEDEIESFEDGNESMVDANEICEDNNEPMVDANEICEDNDEPFEDNNEHADILGADISRYKLSTGTYYLCRHDYSQLMEVGRLTPDWFKNLVGDTIDYTEIAGWRKTGKPDQRYQSFTELKTIGCSIYGPQLEEFYMISELSKSPLFDETMEDKGIDETMESKSSSSIEETEYSESDSSRLTIQLAKGKGERIEVEKGSVNLRLDNELVKEALILSMEAHKHNQHYLINNKKHGAGSSLLSASVEFIIIAFHGLLEENWYHDDCFGEIDVDKHLLPSLQRIGEDRLAKVNRVFLQRFQELLNNDDFKSEVEKAVMEKKKILFTGHSSGGAIASFATLWMLDEYTRKRGIKSPIGCITFGSPLIGDETLSHAVRREKWAGHFTHFVMEHDIVPRIMLAPKTSIKVHLPMIFQQNIKHITRKPSKIARLFSRKPERTIDVDQLLKPDEAVLFFENILSNASTVASHDASVLMEATSSLMEKLSVDFVKVSPYRPFGHYVFCTCDKDQDPTETRQLLVVENPNAVLQLLVYFLQLPNENQDLAKFAINSLAESFSYEEELNKSGLQLQNMVHLKDLNKQLLRYDGTTDDVVHISNRALFELDLSARMCLMAVEEAENRKKENEQRIITSMSKYQTQTAKDEEKIIEVILEEIRNYKVKKTNKNMDYYEAFKLQNNEDDFRADVNRLELANIYDEIVEMVRTKDLPDEFEVSDEWVTLGTKFRRLVEPLDIANYYRHLKDGIGYMSVRPKRYKFTQRWHEHANAMGFEMISESNFMAEVEELKKDIEEPRNKTLEEIKARFESTKDRVQKWKSDDKIPNDDVYWGEFALSMLAEKLLQIKKMRVI